MERLHYLETGSTDPAYNLAFEEYVLTHRMDGDYLILWQNDNTVVVGQNQNTAAEINRAFVEAHGVHVVRRTTGGGAVYHDLGNLNYSFITDEEAGSLRLERFTAPVVDALASLGLQAEASGRNDILVEGRKVSGTAQRVYKTRILHHGTLLPLDVGLHIALHEPIERLVVKDVVLAIFIEEENTAEADRFVGRRNNHLQTETTAVEHQFRRAGEVERLRDKPGNGFHEAACASLHGAAAIHVSVQDETASTGVGDAADQLEAFRVTPSGPARDRKRRFGWEHNGLSYPGSTVALHYI